MAFEVTQDNAMTAAIYGALGETVSYTGITGTFQAIITRGDGDFTGFDTTAADGDVSARVRVADVAQPTRGDTLTDADATAYVVDSYRRLNASEWALELRNG